MTKSISGFGLAFRAFFTNPRLSAGLRGGAAHKHVSGMLTVRGGAITMQRCMGSQYRQLSAEGAQNLVA